MMQIKEQIKGINRENEVKQQRRSAAMHTFNLQRSQAYEVYMEKKRAREKLQNDEAAYDWLDLGPETKEEKPKAAKEHEHAEADAKASKARAALDEQRRRQKLNKQRQKIFDKMDKK